jgi:hypothetical protein
MVQVDSVTYSSYESSNLQNVEFFDSTGTVIPSWLESGASSSSTSTIYWLKISNGIPAESNITVYMGFASPTTNLFNTLTTGEGPKLSPSYGQYDDGSNVFAYYWNFAGTSLPSGWAFAQGTSMGGYSVDNGASFYTGHCGSFSCPNSFYGYFNTPLNAGSYVISTNMSSYLAGNNGEGVWFGWWSDPSAPTLGGYNGNYVTDWIWCPFFNCYSQSPGYLSTFDVQSNGGTVASANEYDAYLPMYYSLSWFNENQVGTLIPPSGAAVTVSQTVSSPPQGSYYLGFFSDTAGEGDDGETAQWVSVSSMPPNGVMPGASLGSPITVTAVMLNVEVTDSSGLPVSGAAVNALAEDGSIVQSSTSNSTGYALLDLSPGNYNVTASLSGYVPTSQIVNLASEVTIRLTLARPYIFLGEIPGADITITETATGYNITLVNLFASSPSDVFFDWNYMGTIAAGGSETFFFSSLPDLVVLAASQGSSNYPDAWYSNPSPVTLTAYTGTEGALMADPVPYVDWHIFLNPNPPVFGGNTTVGIILHNPFTYPLNISRIDFEISALTIGGGFSSIGQISNITLAANETKVESVFWTSTVNGHHCVGVLITYASDPVTQWAQNNYDVENSQLVDSVGTASFTIVNPYPVPKNITIQVNPLLLPAGWSASLDVNGMIATSYEFTLPNVPTGGTLLGKLMIQSAEGVPGTASVDVAGVINGVLIGGFRKNMSTFISTLTTIQLTANPTTVILTTGTSGSSITVTALDQNNNPMSGVPITLSVVSGLGVLSQSAVITDSSGQATSFLTLSQSIVTSVQVIIQATSSGVRSLPVTITFEPPADVVGVQNIVTVSNFNIPLTLSVQPCLPAAELFTSCFSIQQDFYVNSPGYSLPTYWIQNIIVVGSDLGGGVSASSQYQVFQVDQTTFGLTLVACPDLIVLPGLPPSCHLGIDQFNSVQTSPTFTITSTISGTGITLATSYELADGSTNDQSFSFSSLSPNSYISEASSTPQVAYSLLPQLDVVGEVSAGLGTAAYQVAFSGTTQGTVQSAIQLAGSTAWSNGVDQIFLTCGSPCNGPNSGTSTAETSLDLGWASSGLGSATFSNNSLGLNIEGVAYPLTSRSTSVSCDSYSISTTSSASCTATVTGASSGTIVTWAQVGGSGSVVITNPSDVLSNTCTLSTLGNCTMNVGSGLVTGDATIQALVSSGVPSAGTTLLNVESSCPSASSSLTYGELETNLWNCVSSTGTVTEASSSSGLTTTVDLANLVYKSPGPIAYTELGYGNNLLDMTFQQTGNSDSSLEFPITVSAFDSLGIWATTSFTLGQTTPSNLPVDLAYDFWIEQNPSPGSPPAAAVCVASICTGGDLEVMIWLYDNNNSPSGSPYGTPFQDTVMSNGVQSSSSWQIYQGIGGSNTETISFVLSSPSPSTSNTISLRLQDFIEKAVSIYEAGLLNPSLSNAQLMGIELGTEYGGSGYSTASWQWSLSEYSFQNACNYLQLLPSGSTALYSMACASSTLVYEEVPLTADQTGTTGISVTIMGSAAPDGTSFTVISGDWGSTQPAGTGSVSLGSGIFYDVQIEGITDGTAQICITNAAVTSATQMQYWDGTEWVNAASQTVTGTTLCGDIPVSALNGTPIVIGTPTITPVPPTVPQFPFGMALLLGLAIPALLLVRKKFSPTGAE